MKKLYILRHAKALQTNKIDDHERPLSQEGVEACASVAAYMQAQHIQPEGIVCSPSARTRGTIDIIAEHYPLNADIRLIPALYLASAGELFAIINRVEERVSSLLISGHNPGLHYFAMLLAGEQGDPSLLALLKRGLPTASLVSFECLVATWQQIEPGLGGLKGVWSPNANA